MLDERSFQTDSTPFNIFESRGNVDSMLNESVNQFQFDSTRFPHIFYPFNNVERHVQTPPTFGSTRCWTYVEGNVDFTESKLRIKTDGALKQGVHIFSPRS